MAIHSRAAPLCRSWFAFGCAAAIAMLSLCGCDRDAARSGREADISSIKGCGELVKRGPRKIAETRDTRFLGKVERYTAECRGGDVPVEFMDTPWVDWAHYFAAGDASTRVYKYDEDGLSGAAGRFLDKIHIDPNIRGIDGALVDLEYQRVELIRFNLFDYYTYQRYVSGDGGRAGPNLKVWPEMGLPPEHPQYSAVGGDGRQLCSGELIRFRTLTGICNDIFNPRMGSTNTVFARNVQFETTTFPDGTTSELVRNRHRDRLGLLKPDPQVVSRKLFTRLQSQPERCNQGLGLADNSPDAHCDYQPAPFFNVLAAFWIQFMTHDWFSHMEEGRNSSTMMAVGCAAEDAEALGCRPDDRMEQALVHEASDPPTFEHAGKTHYARAPKTFRNTATAWWDASQIYGYDEASRSRVKRDPNDRAKLAMVRIGDRPGAGEQQGYLPVFETCAEAGPEASCRPDTIHPAWTGQEATAFPDNWTIGMSFYHNIFAREHNVFVDEFRTLAARAPEADSGLRHPLRPEVVIAYEDISDDELFEIARLVVAMEIAKIHTIEWTPQLLYGEPLHRGMNANWSGLFAEHDSKLVDPEMLDRVLERLVVDNFGQSDNVRKRNQWYSVFAAGPGIVGLGSRRYEGKTVFERLVVGREDVWSLANPEHVNGGTNHFGSPFNFPEEFVTVYRLHPLVPDLLEYREWQDPNRIQADIPVVSTFRGEATAAMQSRGLANWALTMGRERLGLLALQNHPQFMQNLPMPRLNTATNRIDLAALDLIRDREHGVPRFNEFRRQYGLRQLTSFDDFINPHLPPDSAERKRQQGLVKLLREVYGQHECDASKIITEAQLTADGSTINDCLGHPDGSLVDNIEDVDTVVGWLAETTRPHGFAISETQFVVFILNASRRLFSDRFFTSSFRPEFYSTFGQEWVMNNGPDGKVWEKGKPNGHKQVVSPLKRVLQRTVPELADELAPVVNAFDPWARDRGEYFSLKWVARKGAEDDPAFPRK